MNEITRLNQVSRSTPDELKEVADELRYLADKIESGEIIAISWVEHRVKDQYWTRWVKPKGISTMELIGGAYLLAHELSKHLTE